MFQASEKLFVLSDFYNPLSSTYCSAFFKLFNSSFPHPNLWLHSQPLETRPAWHQVNPWSTSLPSTQALHEMQSLTWRRLSTVLPPPKVPRANNRHPPQFWCSGFHSKCKLSSRNVASSLVFIWKATHYEIVQSVHFKALFQENSTLPQQG